MIEQFRVFALIGVLSFVSASALASGGGACEVHAEWKEWHAGSGIASTASLQRGASNFVNYCMGCHSLQYMRYSRLGQDLDIPDTVLTKNLMFSSDRVHDFMKSSMPAADAERWFGRAPPDLSLTARAKGNDYIYQFLKTFYLDETKTTGVNNLALEGAAMPHVLADLQGVQKAVFVLEKCVENGQEKMVRRFDRFEAASPGRLSPAEYDIFVRDLVGFLDYVAEPTRAKRQALGIWVLLFVAVFTLLTWALKKEIWKEVK